MKFKSLFMVLEPFLLFILFFVPVTAGIGNTQPLSFFTSPEAMAVYCFFASIHIILTLYLIKNGNMQLKQHETGLIRLRGSVLPLSVIYTILMLLFSNAAISLLNNAGINSAGITGDTAIKYLHFYAAVSVVTGYREELFFRSCLIPFFSKYIRPFYSILLSSVMFSLCHISQGYAPILLSFANSIILSLVFIKHRNIHINSTAHAFFNLAVLVSVSLKNIS